MKTRQTETIKWKLINSGIAGLLVFFGAFADGIVTQPEVLASFGAAMIIFLTKFRDSMQNSKKGQCLFNFV